MKQSIVTILFTVLMSMVGINALGQTNQNVVERTINVETAGTLPDLIPESEKYVIEFLTLTGELNGTDFRLLRDMAGCNYLGEKTVGKLKVLDFSEAKIVAGGEKYVDSDHIGRWGGNFRSSVEQDDVLPAHVFMGCNLTSVKISNRATAIGNWAFALLGNLSSFSIPNTVKTIGRRAFQECSSLASVSIPASVSSIADDAFIACNSISSVNVGSGNTIYDSRNNCNAIIETATNTLILGCGNTIIPDDVVCIGDYAFMDRGGFTSLVLPNTLIKIGEYAFGYCTSLKSVKLPDGVTIIGPYAFEGCSALQTINIPNEITTISFAAFRRCSSLTSLHLPKTLTSIGDYAFQRCNSLVSIDVDPDNQYFKSESGILLNKEGTSILCYPAAKKGNSYRIPDNVTVIGKCAFGSCSNLASVNLHKGITTIGDYAFEYCSNLPSITIPNNVTSIGGMAFFECNGLTSVVSRVATPFAINEDVFSSGIYTMATLTVPKSTKDAYLATDGWNKFTTIKESNTIHNAAEAIDLGLTSGTLWASCNIGASSPEEYGDYFAWGETAPKSNYDWSTYKFGNESNFTKYNSTDGLTQLELEDDAAYVILGKGWRMPTHEEELELAKECTWEDVEVNGISGYKITGPNGNSIFMPRGGIYDGTDYTCDGTTLSSVNSDGWYWSSTLNSTGSSYAQGLCFFHSLLTNVSDHERCDGHNIRPVYVGEKETIGKVADVVDLGLSVKWASWNVGAEAPEDKGNHYAWGELSPKTDYSTSTYKFYDNGYTKYGSIDQKYRLDSEDDVAKQLWGDNWRIPTYEELKELKEKCTFTKTEINGIPVTKVEGPNGNFIYFPYPGNYTDKTICFENSVGSYWSSDLGSDDYSKDLDFENGTVSLNGDYRYHGQSIRPVYMDMYTDISTLTDAVYANMATGHKGGDGTLIINLKNSQATNAYSFDLLLPEGVTLAKNNKGEFIYNMSVRHKEHSGTINYNETTGMYSIAVLSLASNEVKGNDGEIFTMKLQIADNVEVGNYPVKIQNAKYSLISGSTSVYMPETTGRLEIDSYIKGDPNGDKSVDIADAVCIVNHIVGKATPSFIEKAADANGDGVVDIADAVRIVNLIVGKINALARQRYVSLPEPE